MDSLLVKVCPPAAVVHRLKVKNTDIAKFMYLSLVCKRKENYWRCKLASFRCAKYPQMTAYVIDM